MIFPRLRSQHLFGRCLGFLFFICASLTIITPAHPVTATDVGVGIRISPVRLDISLDPGQHYTGEFEVANSGSFDLHLVMDTAPYYPINENYEPDYVSRNSRNQIVDWISYDQPEFSLAPGESTTVIYHVDVPTDVPAGGQYAMLFARTAKPEGASEVQSISRAGPILLAQVNGNTRSEGELLTHSVTGLVLATPFAATATIKNTGNVDFPVTNLLEIRNFFTGAIEFTNLDNPTTMSVLPETTRIISLPWEEAPSLGLYRVKHSVSFLGEEHNIEKIVIFFPFWVILVITFIIVFLVVWLILRRRSRQKLQNIL